MSNKTKHIIGIAIEIDDPNTGALASFHVISSLNTSWKYNNAQATLDSYASRKAFDLGKQPMGSQIITLYGSPENECSKAWAYRHLVAPIPEGTLDVYQNPVMPHDFTGGELVEA